MRYTYITTIFFYIAKLHRIVIAEKRNYDKRRINMLKYFLRQFLHHSRLMENVFKKYPRKVAHFHPLPAAHSFVEQSRSKEKLR